MKTVLIVLTVLIFYKTFRLNSFKFYFKINLLQNSLNFMNLYEIFAKYLTFELRNMCQIIPLVSITNLWSN